MQNYKDLNVWKKAHARVRCVYTPTNGFPKTEQFNLTSQSRRVLLSHDLSCLEHDSFKNVETQINEVKGMLISLINMVRKKP